LEFREMAKAKSWEWTIANRIVDDIYPEPDSELNAQDLRIRKEFVNRVVRDISTNREEAEQRLAKRLEYLALEFFQKSSITPAFHMLRLAFEITEREYPLFPEAYLEDLQKELDNPRPVNSPEIFVKR
jgi:hypothetical protein